MQSAPDGAIGVFDSGVGGLTVLKALMERLPNENTVYLGDTARVPYGTKSGEVVTKYSLANARVLLEQQVKMLVVACNTASAVALPALTSTLSIPVVGVIQPGAQAAARATKTGKVAVIGTPGTIASGAYQRALKEARSDIEVTVRSCPLFVPLAEEGWVEGDVPTLVAREYLGGGFLSPGIDTLVLGCTHYPLLSAVLQRVVGPSVMLVDSAHATAEKVAGMLESARMLRPTGSPASHSFFVTDTPDRFVHVSARFLGAAVPHAEQIDLSLS